MFVRVIIILLMLIFRFSILTKDKYSIYIKCWFYIMWTCTQWVICTTDESSNVNIHIFFIMHTTQNIKEQYVHIIPTRKF